jgi:DNA-binding Lrp family transcriptional regulator
MGIAAALDRTDFGLLDTLQKNARTSNKELARAVGLAESSCLERVRRLQAGGVLLGSHAEVAPEALGIGLQALIRVRLARHARKQVEAFQRHALARPEVVAVFHVTGEDDFLIQVAVRDAAHLRDLALDAFTSRAEVARIQTSLLFRCLRKHALPAYPGT